MVGFHVEIPRIEREFKVKIIFKNGILIVYSNNNINMIIENRILLIIDIIINLFILFQKYLLNFAASPAQKLVSIVMRRSIALAQVEGEAISY
jgi:hypothetical protein